MDYEETMVEQEEAEFAADDTLQEELAEETDESEDIESSLDEDTEEPAAEEPEKQGTSEPGWIKKRVDKAVQRAVAQTEARMRAMFDEQMAPIREQMLEAEAKELVRKGTVKDLDTARELARYRQGIQPREEAAAEEAPVDDDPLSDPAISAQLDMLAHQADTIKERRGVDVVAEFENDEDIRQLVVSGEWDFYDVADYLEEQQSQKRRTPAPMRSPNGASGSAKSSIAAMSDEQFARLEKKISSGARYSVR